MPKRIPKISSQRSCDYCGSIKVAENQLIELPYYFNEKEFYIYYCINETECKKYKTKVNASKMYYTEDMFTVNMIDQHRLRIKLDILIKNEY